MPYPVGTQFVSFGLETTRGTAVPPTLYVPAKSPQWSPMITELMDDGFRGSMVDTYDQIAGQRYDEFDFTANVYADTFPAMLRAILGSSDTVTGSVAPYTHVIGLLNTGQGQPPSYTIAYGDASEVWELPAAQGNEMALKFNATGLLEASMKYITNPAAIATGITPSYSTVEAIPSWNCVASIGGTAVTNITDGELDLKRGAKPIDAITGTQVPYRLWAGVLQTSGKLTFVMENDTQFDYYLNNSKGEPIDLKFTDPGGDTVELHLSTPAWKMAKKTGSKEYMEVEMDFIGLPNTTDAVAGGEAPIKTTTTNSVSAAY